MFAAEPDAIELEGGLTLAPAPGWREPGRPLTLALEGSTPAGCELPCGVAWWMLKEGGGLLA